MSATALKPASLIDDPIVPLDLPLLKEVLWAHRLTDPEDYRLANLAAVVVAPSTNTVTHRIEPPLGDDEWLIYSITFQDQNSVDGVDTFLLLYTDEITTITFELNRSTMNAFQGSVAKYPAPFGSSLAGAGSTGQTFLLPRPIVVKKKATGERWMTLRLNPSTTATVGNRSFIGAFVYVARRRLNW